MPPSTPFVDRATGALDTDQILAEAIPIAKLIGLFVAIALVPLAIVFLLGGSGCCSLWWPSSFSQSEPASFCCTLSPLQFNSPTGSNLEETLSFQRDEPIHTEWS